MIILNTPQNIPGKVYSESELRDISSIAIKHDLLVLADEVYEPMVYDSNKHVRIATLPGMFERTITLGSAGKSFSVTGWKTGWVIAHRNLAESIWLTHTNTTFCSIAPLQEAIGIGFEKAMTEENTYFQSMKSDLQRKRDKLCKILESVNLQPIVPQGSYFILADTSLIPLSLFYSASDSSSRDYQFCRWLTKEIGVACIPPTAFYSQSNSKMAEHLARFCFIKKDETLEEAGRRLSKLK